MNKYENLTISDLSDYTSQVSHLVCILNIARHKTLKFIKDLKKEELDYQFTEESASIGTLLMHICAIEVINQCATFYERPLNAKERRIWSPVLGRNMLTVHYSGENSEFYAQYLFNTRLITLEYLKKKMMIGSI